MTDNRGTELKSGQLIAYNLSGEIALGEITDLTESVYEDTGYGWQRRLKPAKIKVRLRHNASGHSAGHISKVTNEKNVLVIDDSVARLTLS